MSAESRVGRIVARGAFLSLAVAVGHLVSGMCLWAWSRQALAVLGSSRQSWSAVAGTLCLSVLAAWWARRWTLSTNDAVSGEYRSGRVWLVSVSVSAVFAVFPAIATETALASLKLLSASYVLTSVPMQTGVLMLAGMAGWFVPTASAVSLLLCSCSRGSSSQATAENRLSRTLVLTALGVVGCEFLAAATGGLGNVLLVAGLLLTCVFAAGLWWTTGMPLTDSGMSSRAPGALAAESTTRVQPGTVASVVLVGLYGALGLFLWRLLDQLVLPVSWVAAVAVAAVAGGVAAGSEIYRGRHEAARFRRFWKSIQSVDPVLVSLLAVCLTVALFESLIWLTLRINAHVVSVFWSTLCLGAGVVLSLGPVGVAIGGLIERAAVARDDGRSTAAVFFASFAGGLLVASWLAPIFGLPANAVLLMVVLIAAVELSRQVMAASWRMILKPQWVTALLVLAVVIGITDPQRGSLLASRLLYDTRVFIASQVEERTETLPYLDEARCVAVAETAGGTVTVWKRRACEYEVRRSGVPIGAVSLDTFVAPQRSGEALQMILPLCLHADPESVLLLGAGGGAALETSVFFPLRQITCVEPDRQLLEVLAEQLFRQMPLDPLADERVAVVNAEPTLSVRGLPGVYDLILASGSQPAFASSATMSSREFLAAASGRLSDDGLFCQPLDIVDLGPDALGSVVQTWQSVFAEVTAFEIGPGRLLLVGRQNVNQTSRFDGRGFLERLQRPHVRTVLAGLGWDWSTVLKVMAYSDADLKKAFPANSLPAADVVNVAFSSTLPFEVTSWGPKYQQTLARLSEVAGTVQFLTGTAGQDPDVKRRLTELNEQSDLIHDKPDHYWAYRGRVKERIKSAPQSELVQIKGEAPRHTLSGSEKRRLEYFEALGRAAQQQRPSAESLNAVAEFDSPFDPLVSPFLHQEIAELAERDPQNLGEIELWHRMHRAFFASPADRSVRNVARTLELLNEQPGLIADPAARGDCLDALLQVLHNRWHNRGDIPPDSSQIVLNDIERSLSAIDGAFGQLANLSEVREMPEGAWPARRLAVEKSLVRPLEAYRSMLLPRHAKNQRRSRMSAER